MDRPLYRVEIEPVEDVHIFDYRSEFRAHTLDLFVGQIDAREIGDVPDVFGCDRFAHTRNVARLRSLIGAGPPADSGYLSYMIDREMKALKVALVVAALAWFGESLLAIRAGAHPAFAPIVVAAILALTFLVALSFTDLRRGLAVALGLQIVAAVILTAITVPLAAAALALAPGLVVLACERALEYLSARK